MKKYYHEKSTKLTDVNNEDDEFEGKNKDEKNE